MSHYLLYIPIVIVIFVVLEACKQDEPAGIAVRAMVNFLKLTVALVAGAAIVYGLHRFL
ncbi:MAG: hypothetical protein ACYTAF_11060 [Planctomycetota bacterium]|jgi:hypothetical protein